MITEHLEKCFAAAQQEVSYPIQRWRCMYMPVGRAEVRMMIRRPMGRVEQFLFKALTTVPAGLTSHEAASLYGLSKDWVEQLYETSAAIGSGVQRDTAHRWTLTEHGQRALAEGLVPWDAEDSYSILFCAVDGKLLERDVYKHGRRFKSWTFRDPPLHRVSPVAEPTPSEVNALLVEVDNRRRFNLPMVAGHVDSIRVVDYRKRLAVFVEGMSTQDVYLVDEKTLLPDDHPVLTSPREYGLEFEPVNKPEVLREVNDLLGSVSNLRVNHGHVEGGPTPDWLNASERLDSLVRGLPIPLPENEAVFYPVGSDRDPALVRRWAVHRLDPLLRGRPCSRRAFQTAVQEVVGTAPDKKYLDGLGAGDWQREAAAAALGELEWWMDELCDQENDV